MNELILKVESKVNNNKPLRLRFADSLRNSILDKKILPNEKIPSTRALAKQLGIHRQTIMEGLNELVAEGWLIAKERKGYIVANNIIIKKKSTVFNITPKRKHNWLWSKKIQLDDFQTTQTIKYNFQSGLPDLRIFPKKEFQYYMSKALKKSNEETLGYGSPLGTTNLTKAIDTTLRRMKNISGRTTIITNGSQEGIYLSIQLLVKPGDEVIIENPGYPPVIELLKGLKTKIIPIKVDNNGIDPDRLEFLVKKNNVRLLFLTPLHQFPTTSTLSAPRRLRVYDICKKYKVPILEDDYDHEFHYKTQPLPPMASEDYNEQIIYLGTLSKLMFPSARIGFMSVPNSFVNNFVQYRRLVTHQNEALLQEALAYWIIDGGFERHLYKMRKIYQKRLMAVEHTLNNLKKKGKALSWQSPSGGMAIWLNINQNSSLVADRALEKSIFVTPEKYYNLNKKDGTYLRVGFTNQSEYELINGVNELVSLL